MVCPFCGTNDDHVIDSRPCDAGRTIRRRRECITCEKRFTTFERVDTTARLLVAKRDGRRVAFSRENILRGIDSACGKRPVSEDAKRRIAESVEDEVFRRFESEVDSGEIGRMVMQRLRDLDEIAYIRFASEYHRFADMGQLLSEAEKLRDRAKDIKDQSKLFD